MTLTEVKQLALVMRQLNPGTTVPSKMRQWMIAVLTVGKLCDKHCAKFSWTLWKKGCGAPDHI